MLSFARVAYASLFAGLMSTAAFAQSVDYATLQETIGEPVTTSVTGKPQRASETPASIEIITKDQIAHSPAHDVPGLLKTYAGVDVNRWTAGQTDVAVRGGVQTYNPRLLVLVDGRQVYLDHYGMTDWNLLGVQLEEIQQIELIRGPAAALFGFNAASAVVNIITTGALSGRSLAAAGEVGTHGYRRLSAVATIPMGDNAGLHLSGGDERDDERSLADEQDQHVDHRAVKRDEVHATFEAMPDAATHLTMDGGYSYNAQLELLPTQVATRQDYHATSAGARIDRDTAWGSVTARAYTNWLDVHYGEGDSGGTLVNAGTLRNRIVVGQLSSLVRLGLKDTLRLGVEYRNNRLEGASLYSPRIDYSVWSASGMLDLHPTDRLALTAAGRLDRLALDQDGTPRTPLANLASDFDRQFVRPSFNAAALMQIGQSGQLRINGGLGYQIPSLTDFGFRLAIQPTPDLPTILLAGSPDLKPVPVWSGEIGYGQLLTGAIRGTVTVFYSKVRHAIASPGESLTVTPVMIDRLALVSRFATDGDFRTVGVEAGLDGTIGTRWHWRANYTFADTHQHLQPIDILAFSPRDTTARHKVNVETRYTAGRWFATTDLRYTSATRQLGDTTEGEIALLPVHAALAWDQKIGVDVGKFEVAVTGENLTHASGASGSPIVADRRLIVGMKVAL